MSLQIGSTQASVNGQRQYLDVAPFIVGATTYVPLRFIAQSLGANVGYDNATRIVAINMPHAPPYVPTRPMPPPNAPPSIVYIAAQQPPPGASVANRFVTIGAQLSRSVRPASVRVWLDGNNITNRTGVSASGFSYKPPAPLDFGSHTVRVTGNGDGGATFDRGWTFTVTRPAPANVHLTINQPAANAVIGRTFVIAGNTVANGRISVTAGTAPLSMGQFNGSTTAGPRGNFSITVTLKTLLGQQAVRVQITATDPVTSQSTQTTLQLRLNQ